MPSILFYWVAALAVILIIILAVFFYLNHKEFEQEYPLKIKRKMNTKTVTTLNQLRKGDSFIYNNRFGSKRTDPWRVMATQDKNGKVAVNQVIDRKPLYKYDELKKGSTTVIFLRHTIPLPGEECLLDDLVPGDEFKITAGELQNWILVKHGHLFSDVRRVTDAACSKGGRAAKVIFIKHKD